jgi:hypothetical protein
MMGVVFWHMGEYTPLFLNAYYTNFEISKEIETKNLRVHLHVLRVHKVVS